jgi:hypothetical protein
VCVCVCVCVCVFCQKEATDDMINSAELAIKRRDTYAPPQRQASQLFW